MSYTPENEQIDGAFEQLLEAIARLRSVCSARIRSDRWMNDHKDMLNDLRNDLNDLEIKVLEIKG